MKDYLTKEIGAEIYYDPITIKENNKTIFIGHGDGIGKGEKSLKLIKKVFSNKTCQWLFSRIHPNTAMRIAKNWSKRSRLNGITPEYLGTNNEHLEQFCISHKKDNPEIDFYVFGHRHLPLKLDITENCKYINTGDWINHFSYAVFDSKEEIILNYYSNKKV